MLTTCNPIISEQELSRPAIVWARARRGKKISANKEMDHADLAVAAGYSDSHYHPPAPVLALRRREMATIVSDSAADALTPGPRSAVSWAAVFAGAVVAIATTMILIALGSGLGMAGRGCVGNELRGWRRHMAHRHPMAVVGIGRLYHRPSADSLGKCAQYRGLLPRYRARSSRLGGIHRHRRRCRACSGLDDSECGLQHGHLSRLCDRHDAALRQCDIAGIGSDRPGRAWAPVDPTRAHDGG